MPKRKTAKKRQGFKAWLITWEWMGNHAKPKEKVVDVLDPRLPPERVRWFVELLYHRDALLSEKISWRLRRRLQPYPATFATLEGTQWRYDITCGHNPWLRARLVDNLVIDADADGKETATWTERYNLAEVRSMIRRIKNR